MKLSYLTNGRDNNFTLIRIVAALIVLVDHSFALVMGTADARPFRISSHLDLSFLAVDVFFVTSGFLVTRSLLTRQDALEFVWARALRVYPALLVMQFLVVFGLGLHLTTLPWKSYVMSIQTLTYWVKGSTLVTGLVTMLPGVFEHNPFNNSVNTSLWTLPYEIGMYAILAGIWTILSALLQRRVRAFKMTIVSCAAGAILFLFLSQAYLMPEWRFLRLFVMFFSGAAMYAAQAHLVLSRAVFWPLLVIVPLMSMLGEPVLFGAYVLALPYLVLYLAYIPSGFVRQYNQLGDYSYGVYIYAWPVQQAIISLVPGVSILELVLVSASLSVALAALSWHLIEQHALRLKRRSVGYASQACAPAPSLT
jgi:peptidoglycan/LPS O-acetylase OafA/YrhL